MKVFYGVNLHNYTLVQIALLVRSRSVRSLGAIFFIFIIVFVVWLIYRTEFQAHLSPHPSLSLILFSFISFFFIYLSHTSHFLSLSLSYSSLLSLSRGLLARHNTALNVSDK